MHELSIAQSIAEIACRHAGGRQISKVELKVGRLRQVVPASLTFSFELIAQGTSAEGAELAIRSVPAAALCRVCGVRTELDAFPFQCAACSGFDLQVVAGEELEVEFIECVEEKDNASRASQNIGR